MWFFLALLGYVLLAFVFILDKFILTESVGKPVVYTFYSTIFLFGALLLFPFLGYVPLVGVDWLWALVSGLGFGFGLWTLFLAVKQGEASHINPFNGAVVTIATFLLASLFLGEMLSKNQMIGVLVLVFGSALLGFEKTKKQNGFHAGFLWAIVSGILFALSHVSAKYLYTIYPFWSAFIWTRATTGLVGVITLFSPAVHHALFGKRTHASTSKTAGKRFALPIIVTNKIAAIAAVVMIQYAAAIGSVTLVFAMSGLQYALMFVMIVLLTKFAPNIFREYYTRKELALEWIAIAFIVIGSGLAAFQ